MNGTPIGNVSVKSSWHYPFHADRWIVRLSQRIRTVRNHGQTGIFLSGTSGCEASALIAINIIILIILELYCIVLNSSTNTFTDAYIHWGKGYFGIVFVFTSSGPEILSEIWLQFFKSKC